MSKKTNTQQIFLEFNDNQALSQLLGSEDAHIKILESSLDITFAVRGNHVSISGLEPSLTLAKTTLDYLYQLIQKENKITVADVETALNVIQTSHRRHHMHNNSSFSVEKDISMSTSSDLESELHKIAICTRRRVVHPRTLTQGEYIKSMLSKDLVFGIGPAGTGKTYLAVAVAVSRLIEGKIDRIILSRPAVEAGERLGFLPGDMKEKVDPYLRPLYDALHDLLPGDQVIRHIAAGHIEIAPLAFMRGRTLTDAFVILDEAQNTTAAQMKMFLTRLGSNTSMVVTGDLTQIDLPNGTMSGLKNACDVLQKVPEIGFTHFDHADVVRHPLVSKIVQAYANAPSTSPKNNKD